MPPKAKLVRRVRPEDQHSTAIAAVANDVERILSLGERIVGMVGGTEALMKAGLDKILAPAIKQSLERKIRELEAENGYMREALLSVVDRDGPFVVDRPTTLGRLEISVDVRNKQIAIERTS